MSLSDAEDGPPNVVPEEFREPLAGADTEPPPPDFASIVIMELRPMLDRIDSELSEVRTWQHDKTPVLSALDNGIRSCFDAIGSLMVAIQHNTNAVLELSAKLDQHHHDLTHENDRIAARVTRLEDWRIEHTGEQNGSLVAAAAAIKGGE